MEGFGNSWLTFGFPHAVDPFPWGFFLGGFFSLVWPFSERSARRAREPLLLGLGIFERRRGLVARICFALVFGFLPGVSMGLTNGVMDPFLKGRRLQVERGPRS